MAKVVTRTRLNVTFIPTFPVLLVCKSALALHRHKATRHYVHFSCASLKMTSPQQVSTAVMQSARAQFESRPVKRLS